MRHPGEPIEARRRVPALLAAAVMVGALLLGVDTSPSVAAAAIEAERALETRVKAAFLFRFIEFVTWPDSAYARGDVPFTIAVVARDAIAEELRTITAARSVSGRAIEVKRVSDPEGMAGAQIVFIGDAERPRLREWTRAAPRHALIVTESDAALAQGSVINFLLADGRVRFEISLESADRRGLRLSSRLLSVAQHVRTVTP